jgi:hypothetical protein
MLVKLCVVLLLALPVVPSRVFAQFAGQVVAVRHSAQIVSAGEARSIVQGSPVASGDLIRTGSKGQVQIVFTDETRIVVGPNSSLKIDATLFRANGSARKFATSAVGGTFRFISGKSPDRVYKVGTPLATMGIRGTVFDYTVAAGQKTDLLVLNGVVRLCASGQRCVVVEGGCQAVAVLQDGSFTQPLDAEEKRALLIRRFPLLANQSDLQPPFRAATDDCAAVRLIQLPGLDERGDPGNPGRSNPAEGGSDPPGGGGNPAE